ncbi:hypothetical protein SLEP1_g50512 [Rubroshorea leprosula]|uniref:Uncharacterized protein n=1 Tax=Rubroshorea leprosula TaxID=152421 RepID=A0AAV5M099_9ROSI|nr:hypothetical protein SLEP1_g50512 [Rubroshorea leprosula]
MSSMLYASEARPLRDSKSQSADFIKEIKDMFKGLSLDAVKVSGPSPGVGHRYKNLQTLGLGNKAIIKNSGPSPGEGHKPAKLDRP